MPRESIDTTSVHIRAVRMGGFSKNDYYRLVWKDGEGKQHSTPLNEKAADVLTLFLPLERAK